MPETLHYTPDDLGQFRDSHQPVRPAEEAPQPWDLQLVNMPAQRSGPGSPEVAPRAGPGPAVGKVALKHMGQTPPLAGEGSNVGRVSREAINGMGRWKREGFDGPEDYDTHKESEAGLIRQQQRSRDRRAIADMRRADMSEHDISDYQAVAARRNGIELRLGGIFRDLAEYQGFENGQKNRIRQEYERESRQGQSVLVNVLRRGEQPDERYAEGGWMLGGINPDTDTAMLYKQREDGGYREKRTALANLIEPNLDENGHYESAGRVIW